MGRSVLFVAIGGAVGSACRFLAVHLIAGLLPLTFPVGTLVINVAGSLIMGSAVGIAGRYLWIHHDWRLFLTAGFCGGFTTFSAFAFENVELLLDKNYSTFAAYSATSFVLCIAAAYAGLLITRG